MYNTDFNLVNCSNCARPHKRRRSRNYLITSNFPVPLPPVNAASLSSPAANINFIYHHHHPVTTTLYYTIQLYCTTLARPTSTAYTLLSQTRPYLNVVNTSNNRNIIYKRSTVYGPSSPPRHCSQHTFRYCWYYYHTIVRRCIAKM